MHDHDIIQNTTTRIDGGYAAAAIRAYFVDFSAFTFCEAHNQPTLPDNPLIVFASIIHISTSGRSSASLRRAVVAASAIHLFNCMANPTKDLNARIAITWIKGMQRRVAKPGNDTGGMFWVCYWLIQELRFEDCGIQRSCNWPKIPSTTKVTLPCKSRKLDSP